jgi:hypothetical protein
MQDSIISSFYFCYSLKNIEYTKFLVNFKVKNKKNNLKETRDDPNIQTKGVEL